MVHLNNVLPTMCCLFATVRVCRSGVAEFEKCANKADVELELNPRPPIASSLRLSTRYRETDTSDSAYAPAKLCANYSTRAFLCRSSISAMCEVCVVRITLERNTRRCGGQQRRTTARQLHEDTLLRERRVLVF